MGTLASGASAELGEMNLRVQLKWRGGGPVSGGFVTLPPPLEDTALPREAWPDPQTSVAEGDGWIPSFMAESARRGRGCRSGKV